MKVRQLFYLTGILGVIGMLVTAAMGGLFIAKHHEVAETAARRVIGIDNLALDVAQTNVAFKTQVQEWKNILLRGGDDAAYAKYKDGFDKEDALTRDRIARAAETAKALGLDDIAGRLAALAAEHRTLGERYRAALASADRSDRDFHRKLDAAVKGMDRAASEGLTKLAEETSALSKREAEESTRRLEAQKARSALSLGIAVLAGVVGFVVLFVIIQRAFNAKVGGDVEVAVAQSESIAAGDLVKDFAGRGAPTGSLLDSMAKTRAELAGSVGSIRHAADAVGGNVSSISAMSAQMSAALQCQAESLTVIASSVEEVSQSVQSVSSSAAHTSEVFEKLNISTADAVTRIQDAIGGIKSVAEEARGATSVVGELNQHADSIRGILGTIKEIAEQTNLLALNAAIEAARAGESGRGFAVVADEVRKLAERTSASTQEVGTMIVKIEEGTHSAVAAMEQVAGHAIESAEHADRASDAMLTICGGVESTHVAVRDINLAFAEQSSAVTQAAEMLARINATIEESHAASVRLAEVATELGGLEKNLKGEVARFQV